MKKKMAARQPRFCWGVGGRAQASGFYLPPPVVLSAGSESSLAAQQGHFTPEVMMPDREAKEVVRRESKRV